MNPIGNINTQEGIAFFFRNAFAGDPLTQQFMDVSGIPNDGTIFYPSTAQQRTGAQLIATYDNFVKDLRGKGTSNSTEDLLGLATPKMTLAFMGGTALRHRIDLTDPANTSKNVLFGGSVTQNGLGSKGNAFNAVGQTAWSTSNHATDQYTIAFYFTTEKSLDSKSFGCEDAANSRYFLFSPNQNTGGFAYGYSGTNITYTKPGAGLLIISRIGTTVKTKVGNGSIQTQTLATGTNPGRVFDLFGRRDGATIGQYCDNGMGTVCAFGQGFTDSQINALAASIISYNTNLSR